MKTAISTISSISQNYRAACKSEQSITPQRVPYNGCSQQNCLSKKNCNMFIESLLIEYKQLCSWIAREVTLRLDVNLLVSNLNKQLFQFERFLAKKLDAYTQEIQALKLVHHETQATIQKLNSTNLDLKEKLKQISNWDATQITPLKKKQNYSIELITKQPLRKPSYSLQEPDKENRDVFPKKKSLKPKFRI